MDMPELRVMAQHCGIQDYQFFTTEKQLVWAIQKARGEEMCYLSDKRAGCADAICDWRSCCVKLTAEWLR